MCLWRNSASFHRNHVWLMKLFETVDIALSGLSRKAGRKVFSCLNA